MSADSSTLRVNRTSPVRDAGVAEPMGAFNSTLLLPTKLHRPSLGPDLAPRTRLLQLYGRLRFDPIATVDQYTRQCSLDVTATDLAVMAATLADGGVNPITREQVIGTSVCPRVLAVMATAGLYDTSGDWL